MCDLFVSEFEEVYGDGYKWPEFKNELVDTHQCYLDLIEDADSED